VSARLVIDAASKAYPRWGGDPTLHHALRYRLPLLFRAPEERWALRDVSLEVRAGQGTGVIGSNGAGKSTLLKLAAGIARPTRGRLLVPERTAAVLSLGDVFDFSLSGRSNAVTTAVAAGMSPSEARERLPDMLAFAELEAFADAPVRTYSDGMRLRLAFGVVAQLEPDLILLDEVIAVGDARFQRKCLEWVRRRREAGAGLLFASHSLEQIVQECDHAVWLDAGGVRASGSSADVVAAYREAFSNETRARTPAPDPGDAGPLELRRNRLGSQEATIRDVRLLGPDGSPTQERPMGGALEVSLVLDVPPGAQVEDPIVAVTLVRAGDGVVCYDTSTGAEGLAVGTLDGRRAVSLTFDRLDLFPGEYHVDVGLYEASWAYAYDYHWHAYAFRVVGTASDSGVFRPSHVWQL
jgi:lipopolysaccharide transport system ATP-binding protein